MFNDGQNEVGWFDEDKNNSSLVVARLGVGVTDVNSAIVERISAIL
jgi:ATP-binding cassette, subfamily B (MDR/TAP), member 1